ncbi:actinin alpha 2 [Mortierella claussenii]|nr:actinin alpha 2 [Mortierella claussenii]
MVRQFAASQLDTQKTAFMRWVNVQLALQSNANTTTPTTNTTASTALPTIPITLTTTPYHVPMTSIERDLRDGKRLIALLEVVSKEPLKPERGNMRIHQMANVSKALAFLEKRTDEPLGSIGNEDIVDGNLKLTLGLVWIIIYRFQIQHIANTMAEHYPSLATEDILENDESVKGKKKGVSSQQVDAKQALLRWVRYQLEDYSDVIPPIQDFHRSWRTGLAFAALIHRHDPDFLPEFYSAILQLPFETSDEWRRTLTRAFEVGLEKMNLPRLLDPEDLVDVETPDERSIMTYVSEYYIVMSKHQMEQDPAAAADLRMRRLQAKDERLAMAGEDQQARQLRLQEEDERRRREEEEELERIRLKRMEIEGWSIRAAERAKEEEEALRKRREEEEERQLQRRLRREQRERERALMLQHNGINGQSHNRQAQTSSMGSMFSDSEHDFSDTDTEEPMMDPKEQERRLRDLEHEEEEEQCQKQQQEQQQQQQQQELKEQELPEEQSIPQLNLEEKLAEYHQGIAELAQWVREQDRVFPSTPDTTSLLDRARDLEPLMEAIKTVEEEQAIKEHAMSNLHDVREELLENESSDLAPEQVSDMDKRWWELETIWTALSNKVVEAKDAAEEVKWIIDCSQEIDRVNGEISKFEAQLEAFAKKRSQETPQDRSQKAVLEQQDVSLSSISFLLKTYVDFLTSLMDPKVHHYTAPEHLTALNNELTTVRLPRLSVVIEKAQQNLANDRLLRSFLDAFVLSEAWIGESVEWLANIEVPIFVTEDRWNGASTVKEYVARDVSEDLDLEYFQSEIDELEGELKDEQSEVNTFRSSGFAKLDEQAKAVMKSVAETQDVTAEEITKTVQDLMRGVMSNLEKVENLLPKEAEHCAYAARVLDYLWEAQTILMDTEQASVAITKWEMRQPDAEVEDLVLQVESQLDTLEASIKTEQTEPTVREAVQTRHVGLSSVARNLRVCFHEKQEAINGDRQMKAFLELTLTCQATLRDFGTQLHHSPPMTGFGTDDDKPFDDFADLVLAVGESLDDFEEDVYAGYLKMGAQVKMMAATSGARQDPTIIQNKLQSVHTLLTDIKAVQGDRERDSVTVAECRKLVASLFGLNAELKGLEIALAALEHLEPGQQGDLANLNGRASQLQSKFAILEQDVVFRHLKQDPSCLELLQDITRRQSSIQQAQERLQSRLEVKQQWNMAWEAFRERSKSLQEYLMDKEKGVLDRGYVTLDCLAADDAVWKRSEDALREAEVANEETVSNLNEFKTSRLPELSALAASLKKVIESAGGLEKMDTTRAKQFRESEKVQRALNEHLNHVQAINAREKHQLDTLRQRHLWARHLVDSQADVDVLTKTCQGLDHEAAQRLKEQIQHLVSLAAKDKETRLDKALDVYSALKDLAVAVAPDRPAPEHLENEVIAFKNQFNLLDLQLKYGGQFAEHAMQVASYLEMNDALDLTLNSVTIELKATDREATRETLDKALVVEKEFKQLSEALDGIVSGGPRPSDKTSLAISLILKDHQADLEMSLKNRLSQTAELKRALEPLVKDYRDLLEYQNGLRELASDLRGHSQWLDATDEKMRLANGRVQILFKSWPEESSSSSGSNPSNSGDVQRKGAAAFDKTAAELSELKAELVKETTALDSKEQDFRALKSQVVTALKAATSHSKQLQAELEGAIQSAEKRIQGLKADMRHKAYELDCLEKQSAWEQTIDQACEWCQSLDTTLAEFVKQQAQWPLPTSESHAASKMNVDPQLQDLDASLQSFEAQLKGFEEQTRPEVEQMWTELCGAVVFVDMATPEAFQDRQSGLVKEYQQLWTKIAYSAEVVKQRKVLERMDQRMKEMEGLEAELAAIVGASESDMTREESYATMKKMDSKIRSLTQDLDVDFALLNYPVDGSNEESRAMSEEINAQVREHVQTCRTRVQTVNQTLKEVLHAREVSKRRQELKSVQQTQDEAIHNKGIHLERVSGLVNWADETRISVASVVSDSSGNKDGTQEFLFSPQGKAKELPTEEELTRLSQEQLESFTSKLEALRQEISEMVEHKKEVQAEVLDKHLDKQVMELEVSAAKNSLAVSGEPSLQNLEKTVTLNHDKISQLDSDIVSKLSEFDTKTEAMLASLERQSRSLSAAVKERIRIDEEYAREQELERLRIQRALEVEQFEASKSKFLTWSEGQLEQLGQLWESRGYISKNEEGLEAAVASLVKDTQRSSEEVAQQETAYLELQNTVESLYSGEEHETDKKRHAEGIESAWLAIKGNAAGYSEILNQMKRWSDLRADLVRFEKEDLDSLEKRVDALRWMHWDAFQPEEEALLQCIEDVETQARDLKTRADQVNAIELSSHVQADHQAILAANRIYFDERLELIPTRIEATKTHMDVIHDTSKEIALHAKFHADLVRVETAIAQQIDAVKVRLGSLERSSCFALNSKALEAVVVAANEICMDGKYQFSVLQEVEYSGLEQTAFDLDMLAADEQEDDEEGGHSSIRTGVQESMQRIRQALKRLEGYIEEDCFETLLAAKFYTHCKATEDIRQWITACRDSMAQLDSSSAAAAVAVSSKNEESTEKLKRQQTKEWKTRHLESLEKKLNAFSGTVQNYDGLSSDFMLLHHPQSSTLDLTEPRGENGEGARGDVAIPVSMRIILRQTVQERTKRTHEDWELLKQEFLAKTAVLAEMNSDDDDNASEGGAENGLGHARRGSSMKGATSVVKAKTLGRFGTEILEDISRVSREVQEMFDHVSSNHSTLSLAVESNGALIKSKNGQARLEMIEGYIRDVLQVKVEKFDAMLSAANEQNEQEQQARLDAAPEQDVSTRSHMRHHEKMVGVAMQRGLIAESMNRLVESCHHQRKEVEETVRVQNAMDLIHEASMLCDAMAKTLAGADSLLAPPEMPTSVSLYNLPMASSSSSVASLNIRSPHASPNMSPSTTISRATAISRERRASKASMRRSFSFSLSSLSDEDVQQWESSYRSLMEELDGYTHDIEQHLDTVSTMADRLNDWRLDENYGVATEHWQKLKKTALAKKQELDRVWAHRTDNPSEMNQGSGVHPLEGQPLLSTRSSVMQPTASSNNRVKAILGSPVEPTPPAPSHQPMRKKRFSTGNIMARGTFVAPSPTPGGGTNTANRSATRSRAGGRMRSDTAPGSATVSQTDVSTPKKYSTLNSSPSLSSLHAMSPTYSQEAKRRPRVPRKNDSTASISSLVYNNNSSTYLEVTSSAQARQRNVYKPDMSNALDVEVARVVNASGFTMKVQKLKDGQSPYLSTNAAATGTHTGASAPGGGVTRGRSDSTSSLVLSGLSDNGGYEGGIESINSSPGVVKTIRGQSRLSVSSKNEGSGGNNSSNGEVGRYVFGDIEPKVCYCRILRSRKVMVRVGGGWSELSKFMEDHASLEQRKAKSKLLSASNSSISVASHFGGSTTVLSGSESQSRQQNHRSLGHGGVGSGVDGSSDSLSEGSGGVSGEGHSHITSGENSVQGTPRTRQKKEMIYHIRPSDDLSLKSIKFMKTEEGLVAI